MFQRQMNFFGNFQNNLVRTIDVVGNLVAPLPEQEFDNEFEEDVEKERDEGSPKDFSVLSPSREEFDRDTFTGEESPASSMVDVDLFDDNESTASSERNHFAVIADIEKRLHDKYKLLLENQAKLYEDKISAIQKTCDVLSDDNVSLRNSIHHENQKSSSFTLRLESQCSEIQQLKDENTKLSNQFRNLQNEVESQRKDSLLEENVEVGKLTAKLLQQKVLLEDYEDQICELKSSVETLTGEVNQLRSQNKSSSISSKDSILSQCSQLFHFCKSLHEIFQELDVKFSSKPSWIDKKKYFFDESLPDSHNFDEMMAFVNNSVPCIENAFSFVFTHHDDILSSTSSISMQNSDQDNNIGNLNENENTKRLEIQVQELEVAISTKEEEIRSLLEELETMRLNGDEQMKRNKSLLEDSYQNASQLRQTITKLEVENRQLQIVISQFRQARKTSKEDGELLQIEREDFKRKLDSWQAEKEEMELEINRLRADVELYMDAENQRQNLLQQVELLRQNLEKEKDLTMQLQHESYSRKVDMDVLEAERLLTMKENDQKTQEINNLYRVVDQLRHEKTSFEKHLRDEFSRELQAKELQYGEEYEIKRKLLESQQKLLKSRQDELESQLKDSTILRRKLEVEFQEEKRSMQMRLEETLKKMSNTDSDVIDRALMANLFVNYFSRKKSKEILELISRMLQLTEEQKIIIGLLPNRNILSSFITSIVGHPTQAVDVEGDNLAELWVNFLIAESGDKAIKSSDNNSKDNVHP